MVKGESSKVSWPAERLASRLWARAKAWMVGSRSAAVARRAA
jgi:hypothetical protein